MNNKKDRLAVVIELKNLRKNIDDIAKNVEAISSNQIRTEYFVLERVASKKDIGRLATAILKIENHEKRLATLETTR